MPNVLTILVHPGSLMRSWADQVDTELSDAILDRLDAALDEATDLIVIHGALSGMVEDRGEGKALETAGQALADRGYRYLKLWGCDAGEAPRTGSEGQYAAIGAGQVEVMESLLRDCPDIAGYDEFHLCGAWATLDGSSGCVVSVRDAIVRHLGQDQLHRVRIMNATGFEEDLDADPEDGIARLYDALFIDVPYLAPALSDGLVAPDVGP